MVTHKILASRRESVGLSLTGSCYRPHLIVLSPTKYRAFTHARHVLSPTLTRAITHAPKSPTRWEPTSHGLNRRRVTVLTESLTRLTVLTGSEFFNLDWKRGKGAIGDAAASLRL